MGFAPNIVRGINTTLNSTCIPGKGCKVTASINFPVITKALPCLTVGHGAIVIPIPSMDRILDGNTIS